MSVRRSIAAVALIVLLSGPSAAVAGGSETTTAGDPGAGQIVTNDAPASLTRWTEMRASEEPKKRVIAVSLILFMTVAGATSAYLMTRRQAEADLMTGNAMNRWMRDRNGVGRGRWE